MNRRAALLLVFVLASFTRAMAEPASAFSTETVTVDGKPMAFRLLKPETVEPGKSYPCILFLHGAGERGTDNEAQLKHFCLSLQTPEMRRKYPCYLIAPQCLPDAQWVEKPWDEKIPRPMNDQPGFMLRYATAALDQVVADAAVDKKRIYLTGLSMGGYGTWELGMRSPERFACMAPVCGGADDSKAAALKDMPLWVWHGGADNVVPVERSRSAVAAVKAAGGTVKYTELPGVQHDSWSRAYAADSGLLDWMFRQHRD